jgi:sortase (surface protein transpeptidase)
MRTLLLSCNDGKTQTSKISVVKIISQVDKTARLTCGTSQMKAQSKAQDNDTLLSITPPSIANIMGVIEIPSPDIKAKIFVSANDTKATYSMVNIDTPLIFKGKITAKNNEDARKKFQNDVPNYIVERLFVKFEMIP